MANGYKCSAKALLGYPYCYFHDTVHRQRFAPPRPTTEPLKLVFPEDRASILLALDQVFEGICSKTLSSKDAGHLLSGLRIAARTVDREMSIVSWSPVESVDETDTGHELGPEVRHASTGEDCSVCPERLQCEDYDPNEVEDAGFGKVGEEDPVEQPEQNQQVESPVPIVAKEEPADENSNPASEEGKPAAGEKKPPAKAEPEPMHPETATLSSLQAVAYVVPTAQAPAAAQAKLIPDPCSLIPAFTAQAPAAAQAKLIPDPCSLIPAFTAQAPAAAQAKLIPDPCSLIPAFTARRPAAAHATSCSVPASASPCPCPSRPILFQTDRQSCTGVRWPQIACPAAHTPGSS